MGGGTIKDVTDANCKTRMINPCSSEPNPILPSPFVCSLYARLSTSLEIHSQQRIVCLSELSCMLPCECVPLNSMELTYE